MRRVLGIVGLVVCIGGCGANDGAQVVASGFSVRDGLLGVGARIEVDQAAAPIALEVTLLAGGRVLDSYESSLPACHPDAACWWGETYADIERAAEVDEVRVEVTGTERGEGEVLPYDGQQREGVVHHVVLEDGDPVYGSWVQVDGSDVAPAPPHDASEEVVSSFYPGPVVRGE